jgi:hypothetical protein
MILLVGDYSSVHYNLSVALKDKGQDVFLISDGDGYKNIKCDIKIAAPERRKLRITRILFASVKFFGIFGIKEYKNLIKQIQHLNDYDVVQFINPEALASLGAVGNFLLLRYLKKRAKVFSLCALGDDFFYIKACLTKKYKYSPMDRLFNNGLKGFLGSVYTIKYVFSPLYVILNFYALRNSDIIIPGLDDYRIAYEGNAKITKTIGLPILHKSFHEPQKTKYPVNIFHAWQTGKEQRKGNDILDKIVKRYLNEYGSKKICYNVVGGIEYGEFIKKFAEADIIFDQIYSYDRGVTAALGMASGKVVFSGFEDENFTLGINATPNEEVLYNDFLTLINSLELIDEIKKAAFDYALENYRSDISSSKYIDLWSQCLKK